MQDDALVVERGDTRNEVDRRLKMVLEELYEWSLETKIVLSQTKTVVMTARKNPNQRP